MTKLTRKSDKGFTLIELMIVVAIIGILAAIAIPNFLRFQLKSKSSEGKVNIAAIRTAEESYLAEFGSYVAAAVNPAAVPGSQKDAFVDTPGVGFDTLGWSPEGNVFFQYAVNAPANVNYYTISATADIDADGVDQQFWGYVKPDGAGTTTAGVHAECLLTGVGSTQDQLNTVGPCDSTSGQSVF
jgi:type IV pilus assembly protein PilA